MNIVKTGKKSKFKKQQFLSTENLHRGLSIILERREEDEIRPKFTGFLTEAFFTLVSQENRALRAQSSGLHRQWVFEDQST